MKYLFYIFSDSSVKKVIVVMTDGQSYDEVLGPALTLQNQQNTIHSELKCRNPPDRNFSDFFSHP